MNRSRSSTTTPDRLRCPTRCCRSCCPRSPTSMPVTSDDPDALPEPPLARAVDWVEVDLDLPGPAWAGGGGGRATYLRETNTMPQWAGSCWYYLRYLDPTNEDAVVDPAVERAWAEGVRADGSPKVGLVDLYVGGVEHAVLHLLYRAVLAQGAVRPRVRLDERAVPAAREPGLHPGRGVRRRARRVRRRRRGRGAGRRLLPRRRHR